VDRPTFADEFLLAVAVAIGDARSRFAQDDAECDVRAGYALFTNNLHAGNSGSGNTDNRFVSLMAPFTLSAAARSALHGCGEQFTRSPV
jgi:hypothetical protein